MRQIGCGAHGGITLALLLVVSTGSCASAPSNGTFALSEVDRRPRLVDRPHAYDSGPPIDAAQRDEAVRQIASCRFEPARLDGRPVAVTGMYMWARIPSGAESHEEDHS